MFSLTITLIEHSLTYQSCLKLKNVEQKLCDVSRLTDHKSSHIQLISPFLSIEPVATPLLILR